MIRPETLGVLRRFVSGARHSVLTLGEHNQRARLGSILSDWHQRGWLAVVDTSLSDTGRTVNVYIITVSGREVFAASSTYVRGARLYERPARPQDAGPWHTDEMCPHPRGSWPAVQWEARRRARELAAIGCLSAVLHHLGRPGDAAEVTEGPRCVQDGA